MGRDFYGLPTRVLENDWIRLEYLASAGPRLVRLKVRGSDQNECVEVPDIAVPTPMESLGPLAKLAPGESVQHFETWDFTTGLNAPNTADGAREVAGALVTTVTASGG